MLQTYLPKRDPCIDKMRDFLSPSDDSTHVLQVYEHERRRVQEAGSGEHVPNPFRVRQEDFKATAWRGAVGNAAPAN